MASDYLAKGWSANAVLLMFLFVAYCIILHMDATNALIDSQAMVERVVCYITAKPAGDNLESGSAIRHLHISYNASYLPTPPSPPPKKKMKKICISIAFNFS